MMTIWKFPVRITDRQTLKMPDRAKVLTVQDQAGEPCLWALVDDASPVVNRSFLVVGTGNPMPSLAGRYVGTFQQYGGRAGVARVRGGGC